MKEKPFLKQITVKRELIDNFEEYPFNIPSLRELTSLQFHPDVTFVVGENGSGKSTLIEAIALSLGFSPEGGTKNVRLETNSNTSPLYRYFKLVKSYSKPRDYYFLRAESFYNLSTYMEEVNYLAAYNNRKIHTYSHGEAFLMTLTQKFKGKGLYILDEPEAALSPNRQLAAIAAIHKLVKNGSQFIIATHSPILLSYPNSQILHLDERGILPVQFEETEHYRITKQFLNNYDKILKEIIGTESPHS